MHAQLSRQQGDSAADKAAQHWQPLVSLPPNSGPCPTHEAFPQVKVLTNTSWVQVLRNTGWLRGSDQSALAGCLRCKGGGYTPHTLQQLQPASGCPGPPRGGCPAPGPQCSCMRACCMPRGWTTGRGGARGRAPCPCAVHMHVLSRMQQVLCPLTPTCPPLLLALGAVTKPACWQLQGQSGQEAPPAAALT
jgi:hypothetical protein